MSENGLDNPPEIQCNGDKSPEVNGGQVDNDKSEPAKTLDEGAPSEEIMQSVLHLMEQHWRHFESDRSYWEMERADLQARSVFLLGEIKAQVRTFVVLKGCAGTLYR